MADNTTISIKDIKKIRNSLNLKKLNTKLEKLKTKTLDPSSINYQERGQLYADLDYYGTLVEIINKIDIKLKAYTETKDFIKTEKNKEFLEIGQKELKELNQDLTKLIKTTKELRVERELKDVDDHKSAIIEIRAGAGGDEASLFASDLYRMYTQYCNSQGWRIEQISSSISTSGGFKEVIAHIEGQGVYKRLKYESGVHRVQRVPITESSGRIHTSTSAVAILPEAEPVEIKIDPQDLKIETMRASGAGGQCVNKTDSAIRITHNPTGITVSCQETKHQAQNKAKAMQLLRARLYKLEQEKKAKSRSNMRLKQIGSMMRTEKIRTYNFPQNRVTDHRIKKSWHDINNIMDGDLDQIIDDIQKQIINQLLASSSQDNNLKNKSSHISSKK